MERIGHYILAVFVFLGLFSCSPRYFTSTGHEGLWKEALGEDSPFELSDFYTYEMDLTPMYIFQNDVVSFALLSPRSTKLDSNRIFFVNAGEEILNRDKKHHFSNSFHQLRIWIPKPLSMRKNKVIQSDSVFMASISGKMEGGKEKIRSAYLFQGVIEHTPNASITDDLEVLNIWSRIRLIAKPKGKIKVDKKKRHTKNFISLLIKDFEIGNGAPPFLEVLAVIDKGYKAGDNHMAIYELDQIFGENLTLIYKE